MDVPDHRRLEVSRAFGEAFRVYRLLFRRSVATAAVVYGAFALLRVAHHATAGTSARILAFAVFVLDLAGPLLVQGALVEIVRNVRDGRAPERIPELFSRSAGRFWRLFGASLVYGFGVALGLLALVIPGLLAAARWALMPPFVMLDGSTVGEARRASRELVKGQTGRVLACIVLLYALTAWFPWAFVLAGTSYGFTVFLTFVLSILTAPYQAHVLTVLYYRLRDPDRPVIDPRVLTWRSVWDGQ